MTDTEIKIMPLEQVREHVKDKSLPLSTQARLNERLKQLEANEKSEALTATLIADHQAREKRNAEFKSLLKRFRGGL